MFLLLSVNLRLPCLTLQIAECDKQNVALFASVKGVHFQVPHYWPIKKEPIKKAIQVIDRNAAGTVIETGGRNCTQGTKDYRLSWSALHRQKGTNGTFAVNMRLGAINNYMIKCTNTDHSNWAPVFI